MRVEEIQFDLTEMMRAANEEKPRTKGLHLSTIYRDLENTVIHPGQRKGEKELTPNELKRLGPYRELGFIWEELIGCYMARKMRRSNPDRYIDPGEQCLDGIYGTPDNFDVVDYAVEEWKATWRSMNRLQKLETDFWVWFVQMKSYCKMLGTDTARLRIFFVNGDYRDSGPQPRMLECKFTQRELDDNWSMIRNHAKRRGWL